MSSQLQRYGNEINAEVDLAAKDFARKDQELQIRETKEASSFRELGRYHFKKTSENEEEERNWRLSKDSRETGIIGKGILTAELIFLELRRQELLSKLSPHNHFIEYKRARLKQLGNTTNWVTESAEFKDWLQASSSVLWFSGKSQSTSLFILMSRPLECPIVCKYELLDCTICLK